MNFLIPSFFLFTASLLELPGASDAQLAILIEKSQLQLQELSKLTKQTELTGDQIRRAAEILEQIGSGIDAVLKPLQNSREYQEALLKYEQEKDKNSRATKSPALVSPYAWSDFEKYFPEEAKSKAKDWEGFKNFRDNLTQANTADLADVTSFEQSLAKAKPFEVNRLQAQASAKNWESNLRLSVQLTEILSELKEMREEFKGKEIAHRIQEVRDSEQITRALNAPLGAEVNP